MDVSSIVKNNIRKYGIEVPNNFLDTYRLDKVDWGNYWSKAIEK